MESTKNRTQIPGDVHHTQLCLDAQMHKRLNVFSAESWSTLKLWISSSEDAAAFCMWLQQEPWRRDGNRRRHLGNSKHDQSWENEARCMLGHDVPAPRNVADYVRPMHIELSLYCIVSVKTHPPPHSPSSNRGIFRALWFCFLSLLCRSRIRPSWCSVAVVWRLEWRKEQEGEAQKQDRKAEGEARGGRD